MWGMPGAPAPGWHLVLSHSSQAAFAALSPAFELPESYPGSALDSAVAWALQTLTDR